MSQELKHTPGPWELRHTLRYSLNGARIIGADGANVANLTRKADKPVAQKEMDGRLIAAAPELYEALEAMLATDGGSVSIQKARTALAKARGETGEQS